MASANYSIDLSANVTSTSGTLIIPGDVLVTSSDGRSHVLATTANRGTHRSKSIAMTGAIADPGQVVAQELGYIPAAITGLGALAGPHQYAGVSTLGRLERTLTITDQTVGFVDEFGGANVSFASLFNVAGTGTGSGILADFTQPAVAGTVTLNVGDSSLFDVAQTVFVSGGGVYTVVSITDSTNLVVRNLGYQGNAAPATVVLSPVALEPVSATTPTAVLAYDPRSFGAKLDGVTDDLPAFQAMHTAMPTNGGVVRMPVGIAWFSDTWRVSKPIHLLGGGGGSQQFACGIKVAPGRTAIRTDNSALSLDGNTAALVNIADFDFKSRILIHGTAGGNALGRGIGNVWNSEAVRKGDCIIAAGGASPTVYFRCTNTGLGNSPVTLSAQPTWNTSLGATTTQSGATFTTESFPTVRANLTVYAAGQQVWPVKDNRFLFVCEGGGTSAAAPPSEMAGGDAAAGVTINDTVTDGTVTWRIRIATALLVASTLSKVRNCFVENFTGPAVSFVGGTGVLDSLVSVSDCNSSRLHELFTQYCGVGVYVSGDNCNGWTLDGLFAINIGTLQPTPNAAAAAGYTNLGGHILHNSSLGSGLVSNMYAQLSTGRAIHSTSPGVMSVESCFQELDATYGRIYGLTGSIVTKGGNLDIAPATASSVLVLSANYKGNGRGVQETDSSGAISKYAALTKQDGFSIFPFSCSDEAGAQFIGLKYQITGTNEGSAETGCGALPGVQH